MFGWSRNLLKKDGKLHQCSALLQTFSVPFFGWYLDQSNKFYIYFLSFTFHFTSTKKSKKSKKSIILNFINAELFPTFDVEVIHMTSQYSIWLMQKSHQIFKPIKTSVTPSLKLILNDLKTPQLFFESEQALHHHSDKY